jgi:hypothetical protein
MKYDLLHLSSVRKRRTPARVASANVISSCAPLSRSGQDVRAHGRIIVSPQAGLFVKRKLIFDPGANAEC